MMVCAPISTCSKNVVRLTGNIRSQTIIRASNAFKQSSCYHYTYTPGKHLHNTTTLTSQTNSCSPINGGYQVFQKHLSGFGTVKHVPNCRSLTFSSEFRNVDSRVSETSEIKCNVGPFSSRRSISLSAGVFIGLLVCFSSSRPYYAEAYEGSEKNVVMDYSVIGIPGDGRCLFRSVVHGACMRSGKPAPNESLQRELADELRARVADEFIKRRKETEWFIEGDFETYVSQMRKPHVWGGEPELWMASHVLRMPITVYMHDPDSGGLISIAEYGQEYEARDRLLRQDDVAASYSRRRVSTSGDRRTGGVGSIFFVLEDENEGGRTPGTPFRWGGAAMARTPGRNGLPMADGDIGTPGTGRRAAPIVGRENLSPAVRGSRRPGRGGGLPNWYPRRPLNDITAVVRAIERSTERRRIGENQQTESPDLIFHDPSVSTLDAQLEHYISLVSPFPRIPKTHCPPTIGKVPKILLDITHQNNGDSDFSTPQKELLKNIDTVEKVVMDELRNLKRTPSAKREERQKRVRTLMTMR